LDLRGTSFPHLIQKRRSQPGFVTYLLNCPRISRSSGQKSSEKSRHTQSQPRSRVLGLPRNSFPFWTRNFITVVTTACHLTLSSISEIQSTVSHSISYRSTLILSSDISSYLYCPPPLQNFQDKLYACYLASANATCPPPTHLILYWINSKTIGEISCEVPRYVIVDLYSAAHS
jgi:hypothetical protein